jgi:hypothetical protein
MACIRHRLSLIPFSQGTPEGTEPAALLFCHHLRWRLQPAKPIIQILTFPLKRIPGTIIFSRDVPQFQIKNRREGHTGFVRQIGKIPCAVIAVERSSRMRWCLSRVFYFLARSYHQRWTRGVFSCKTAVSSFFWWSSAVFANSFFESSVAPIA